MIVSLDLHGHTCPNDGTPIIGTTVASVRVNLNSLRGDSHNLIFIRGCKVCNYVPPTQEGLVWRLTEESAAKVEAAREKIIARRKKIIRARRNHPAAGRG